MDQACNAQPLLRVEGVTLQYKTREHLGHRHLPGELRGAPVGPLRAARVRRAAASPRSSRRSAATSTRSRASIALKGARGHEARPRPRDGVPGVRPAPALEDGEAERHVRARGLGAPVGPRGRRPRHGLHREGEAHALRRQLPAHALRRDEAARGHRARHGDGARHPADGRAVRRARRAHAPQDAGRAAAALGGHALHRPLRDPLDPGGDPHRQPHPAAVAPPRAGEGGAQQRRHRPRGPRHRTSASRNASTACCSREIDSVEEPPIHA